MEIINYKDKFDKMRLKWHEMLSGKDSYDIDDIDIKNKIISITKSAKDYWDSMSKDFEECDYLWQDIENTIFSACITESYERLRIMALALHTKGSLLENNSELESDIINALDWMYENRYNEKISRYDNWWHWEIGTPLRLNDCIILMYNSLSYSQIEKYSDVIYMHANKITRTGANRIWQCTVICLIGLIKKNASMIEEARDGIEQVFSYVTKGDGFYKDGSFIQHNAYPYTGGYGVSLLKELSNIMYLMKNTEWEVKCKEVENLYSFVYDSYAPVVYKGLVMDMLSGREISRYTNNNNRIGNTLIQAVILVSQIAPEKYASDFREMVKHWILSNKAEAFFAEASIYLINLAKDIINNPSVEEYNKLSFNKVFACMDRIVHQRPNYAFGISMYSERIYNYESINKENLKGWHTSDGMTYLYNNDLSQFSDNFGVTVNPYRLPGTTVNSNTKCIKRILSDKSWVGGTKISGIYGVGGMELNPPEQSLFARKSWFMFDDEIVALGSGINSSDNKVVETVIENRKINQKGDNDLTVNGEVKPKRIGWNEKLEKVRWIHLNDKDNNTGIGYVFLEDTTVLGLREERKGKWSDINICYSADIDEYTRNYITLWLEHGINPKDGKYSYIILPDINVTALKEYSDNPSIVVLENSKQAHGVKHCKLDIVGINFWEDKIKRVDFITCNKKASVMMMEKQGEYLEISVSDPTMKNEGYIKIEINKCAGKLISKDSNVIIDELSPTIKLSINVKNMMGKSSKVKLSLV